MVNTSVYLKRVWLKENNNPSGDPSVLGLSLFLCTIPFPLWVNNVSLGIYAFIVFYSYKKGQFAIDKTLLWPIILFLLAWLSVLWSIDVPKTWKSIPRQIPFLVVPILFWFQPKFTAKQRLRVLELFSKFMVATAIFFLLRACFRFVQTKDIEVFFYHELVTLALNAIHVSAFITIAFFYFLIFGQRFKITITSFLALFLILLASKNIIVIWGILIIIYVIWHQKKIHFSKKTWIALALVMLLSTVVVYKIKDRFLLESQEDILEHKSELAQKLADDGIKIVNIHQAWYATSFSADDFFSGSSFRVYQIRLYKEMMQEDPTYFLGYGFNATLKKRTQKAQELGVFMGDDDNLGYHIKNFHNQYIQYLAELGLVGFLLLTILLGISLKNAIKNKDFLHFVFSILMISLFLTECFLWRQRGVAFFIGCYCLFNAVKNLETQNNRHSVSESVLK